MTQAVPIILGLTGTPIVDAGSTGQSTLVQPVTSGNATPCVLVPAGRGSSANLSLVPIAEETTNWVNAVIANGGTVSNGQKNRVNLLISSLIASGSWAKSDDYHVHVTENSTQALTSLKRLALSTIVGGVVFAAGEGVLYNGSSYIDTGFAPGAGIQTASNTRLAAYLLTSITAGAAVGVVSSNQRINTLFPFLASAPTAPLVGGSNGAQANYSLPQQTSLGYSSLSRNGTSGANTSGYKNGRPLTRVGTPASVATTLIPALSYWIGGINNAGVLGNPMTGRTGFAAYGQSLIAAEELSEYQAIQAYMTAWGVAK